MTHVTGPRKEKVTESLTPEKIKTIGDAIAAVLHNDDHALVETASGEG